MGQLEDNDLIISQIVRLELQYLFEVGRINVTPDEIIKALNFTIGLKISQNVSSQIIAHALDIQWTRDVFDRLITAEADFNKSTLITKDKKIRRNYPMAIW